MSKRRAAASNPETVRAVSASIERLKESGAHFVDADRTECLSALGGQNGLTIIGEICEIACAKVPASSRPAAVDWVVTQVFFACMRAKRGPSGEDALTSSERKERAEKLADLLRELAVVLDPPMEPEAEEVWSEIAKSIHEKMNSLQGERWHCNQFDAGRLADLLPAMLNAAADRLVHWAEERPALPRPKVTGAKNLYAMQCIYDELKTIGIDKGKSARFAIRLFDELSPGADIDESNVIKRLTKQS